MKNLLEMVDGVVDEFNVRGLLLGEMSKFLIKMMKDEVCYVGKRLYE